MVVVVVVVMVVVVAISFALLVTVLVLSELVDDSTNLHLTHGTVLLIDDSLRHVLLEALNGHHALLECLFAYDSIHVDDIGCLSDSVHAINRLCIALGIVVMFNKYERISRRQVETESADTRRE